MNSHHNELARFEHADNLECANNLKRANHLESVEQHIFLKSQDIIVILYQISNLGKLLTILSVSKLTVITR